jgi:hypothetical protein
MHARSTTIRIIRAALMAACLVLPACRVTREVPASPAEVIVSAEFTSQGRVENPAGPDLNELHVVLMNARGKVIQNDSVRVYVNGVRLPLWKPAHFYSTTRTAYTLNSGNPDLKILPDSAYGITVVWPDGRLYYAGRLRTPPAIRPAQLHVPARHADGPLRIGWSGIPRPAKLAAYAVFTRRDSAGNPVSEGGESGRDTFRRRVGARTGGGATGQVELETPLFGETRERRLSYVTVELIADTVARAGPAFHRDSRIRAERRIEAVIDVQAAREDMVSAAPG